MVSRKNKDRFARGLSLAVTVLAIAPLLWIIGSVIINGVSAIDLEFLMSIPAPYGESGGGIANAIFGTLIINAMASMFGIPVGILTGMYLSEYATRGKLSSAIRASVESFSGVPSIIFGIFAFTLIVTNVRHYTALAAAFALGIMMIPIVAKATEESMRVVSDDVREAAIALGMPKWVRTVKIVLGVARGGVITGSLLAFARISGETAPLLFTALFSFYWPTGIDQPMATLQVLIYNFALSGYQDRVMQAWGASLLLVILVVAINIVVKIVTRQKYKEGI
ncbi:MAG TPA: phosphate ABC transporter permease PstA [Candidatus Methanomethylicus sp.]|nr:phosphate ABC transporter permease PstA [Candidatus Methanomethylicus sp.]HRU81386.1 phosphate ABC transporter permease PstA [Candidatus Methanomethylicus sp.]